MDIAGQIAEWSRILEDTSNKRFTADLFYEAYNQACDYLALHAPYEQLAELSVLDIGTSTSGSPVATEYSFPTIANSEVVRLYNLTLATLPCIKTPITQAGITNSSYYASTDANPRYIVTNNGIKFLHIPTTSLVIGFYLIKKQPDVASITEPIISLALQRVALRMSVDYAKWTDEVISRDGMMKRWDGEIQRLQAVAPQGDM